MRQSEVKVGDKFERLEVLEIIKERGRNKAKCRCNCQNKTIKIVFLDNLISGHTKSCKCLQQEKLRDKQFKHGLRKHPLYSTYLSMLDRCYNTNHNAYCYYGGRGITVCDEWKNNMLSFLNWGIENGYQKDLTLDRLNNNNIYCPENCRWATRIEQQNNSRHNRLIEAFGEIKTLANWARDERCKCKYYNILFRINAGWNNEDAITTEVGNKGVKK